MRKPVKISLINSALEEYEKLESIASIQISQGVKSSPEIQLLKSINQKFEFIRLNPSYGDKIQKRIYYKTINVRNLWRVELAGYWRMLYTIRTDKVEIMCFILDILDHARYDKKFGYRKK
ncbi:hypothetical protein JW826_05920 [Candidatus Woesearchaeota archaeon]|nr:hypothetical protein [Candidatus Woesearchaeota archaeon]